MIRTLLTALSAAGAALSLRALRLCGSALGAALWAGLPGRRRETAARIGERLGLDAASARALARRSFGHNAQSFLEILMTRRVDPRFLHERVEFENPGLFDALRTSTRPIVAATAHLGAWELLVGLMGAFSPAETCHVVVRLPRNAALAEAIVRLRSQPRIHILPHRDAARKTLSHLRSGGKSAFLVDHNCKRAEAEFLPFLGRTAAVNKGPAILALRARAEVWPIFLLRLPDDRFRFVTLPVLDTARLTGDLDQRVREICRFYTRAVEDMVLRYPDQWFWMHRRWKTRPEGEEGDD